MRSFRVIADSKEHLEKILTAIGQHGAVSMEQSDCQLVEVEMNGVFPEGFYATTNQETEIRIAGDWFSVQQQEMGLWNSV